MKLQKEHIVGVIIGLVPIVVISIVFRDNDVLCRSYLKSYVSMAISALTLLDIAGIVEVVLFGAFVYFRKD